MISFYTSLVSQPAAVGGSLRTLCCQLPYLEGLVLTEDQRLFASTRDGVYELLASADGSSEKRLIEVTADGVPGNCMKNGIATDGNRLYLACAHVQQSDNPLVRTVLRDLNDVEQTARGLLQLYMAAFTFRVDSWILDCNLKATPRAFDNRLASLPQDLAAGGIAAYVLASGIAIDPGSGMLYLANSAPGLGAAIYRMAVHGTGDAPGRAELWHRPPGCRPNGLKLIDGSLCYTGNGWSSAVLGRVPINADGSAGQAEVIEIAALRLFEDFDAVRQGFVVAEPGDSTGLQVGALRFVSNAGRTIGLLRHAALRRPCAVAVAKADSALFAAGSVLIADRHEGRVLQFVPDEPWRQWLRAGLP
ncbi:MAG: hypothetical protein JNN21_07805 [Candidatus Accumulibacter sp.]|jgi:hypothetical protein|uniref:hypothetical protein n=1 Tax=Accumulibacter sp. TaxID=2053492 RepID=UPI001A3AB7D9|nr:hypothetical protein [Accumulibacter sp.]MBL8391764.1 hypothetical protein [Accumulibacter sp.]HRD89422.1 hypothetical protein [Accumulibacter sp.]